MLMPRCRTILWSPSPPPIRGLLEEIGCDVAIAATDEQAAELKAAIRPEVIFLHNVSPRACRRLKRTPPVLQAFYLALLTEDDILSADFSGGFDDFLMLPLSPAAVIGRVRLWRWRREHIEHDGKLRFGPVAVDQAARTVTADGEAVQLTYKEYELLCLFLRHRDQTLDRDTILDTIWGTDYYGGNRTVDIHVRRLRNKIPELSRHITTVHRCGYLFSTVGE